MRPTEPGRYMARELAYDMRGHKLFSAPYIVEVVSNVPNPRDHKLLVKTDLAQPKYKSLDCFEWP